MKDNNCIFCKIANGDIPSRTIYENDLVFSVRSQTAIFPAEQFMRTISSE